ncbi:Stp1/IreP family PP2C-type Ser/Thr phosphatase [bacterium]|nr:Stp1/IreP family PP2C-type Ser/Thr phosphatase [bacterium]
MKIVATALTDVGRKRDHNEDNFYMFYEENLFMVADGMGGHEAGEVASKMAVDCIQDFFVRTGRDPEATWPYKMFKDKKYDENRLMVAILEANKKIFNASQKTTKKKSGMGTTITATLFVEGGVYIGWVGDSRIYRVRKGKLEQVSEDHSLLNEMIKKNDMSPEEIENFPHKNVILRAVGLKPYVEVDVKYFPLEDGDIYLLCSDGLSGEVPDNDIRRIVVESNSLEEAAKNLIQEANKNGGKDNVTVALIQYFK